MHPLDPFLPLYVTLPPCTTLRQAAAAGDHHRQGTDRYYTNTTILAKHPHLHAHENVALLGLVLTHAHHHATGISPASCHHHHDPSPSPCHLQHAQDDLPSPVRPFPTSVGAPCRQRAKLQQARGLSPALPLHRSHRPMTSALRFPSVLPPSLSCGTEPNGVTPSPSLLIG